LKNEYLLEIGSEEIPAGFILPALSGLKDKVSALLLENKISFDQIETYGTPRRMTLVVIGISERQPDIEEEVIGPPKKVAINDDGEFTKAALGFANTNGIDVKDLKFFTKEKKEYVGFVRKKTGEETASILTANLPSLILSLNFPKNMRWKEGDIRFVRPIHWILSVMNGRLVEFSIGEIRASNKSYGHRFMSNKAFEINNFEDYKRILKENFVIWDHRERLNIIKSEARKISEKLNAVIDEDEELFETINFLCELPCPLLGSFDEKFLKLPQEILINTMKKHQKYIPLRDKNGKLLPNFITFSNTKVENEQIVIEGNNRVIRARFSDAEYYFEKDKKTPLKNNLERLKKVVFQIKLGSYYEKTERLIKISEYLASKFCPELVNKAKDAALLSKADLVTGMVYEFPSLQGIIGGELTRIQGEDPEIAQAIYEHYLPQSPEDAIPQTKLGLIISLADKLDNVVGFFGNGLSPKGASDPYGLRRQTIGIIRIILEGGLKADYTELFKFAYDCLKDKLSLPYDKLMETISDFLENRFFYQLQMQGYDGDIISAVISLHPKDLLLTKKIIEVLDREYKKPEFKDLAFAFKRVSNITKGVDYRDFDMSLFKEKEEFKLFEVYKETKDELEDIIKKEQIESIPQTLLKVKPCLDEYFEKVLVMDKDEMIKRNRLGFLTSLKCLYEKVLDFSKIQI